MVDQPGTDDAKLEVRRWLSATLGVARTINDGATLPEVLAHIAFVTCELAGFDFSAVFLPDDEGSFLYIAGSHGLRERYEQELNLRPIHIGPTELGEAPTSRALRLRQPIVLTDIWSDPGCAPWEAAVHEQGVRSLLCVPLLASKESIGVLNGYRRRPQRIEPDDIAFMEAVADQAALAVETIGLHDKKRTELRASEAKLAALSAEHAHLTTTSDLQHSLLLLLRDNGGLIELVGSLSQATQANVLIESTVGETLACSLEHPFDLEETLRKRRGALRPVDDDLQTEGAAIAVSSDSRLARLQILGDTGHALGHLWLADSSLPIRVLIRAMETAAVAASLILARDRVRHEVQWRMTSDLVEELLWRGDRVDPTAATSHARRLGIDLSSPQQLLVLSAPKDQTADTGRQRSFVDSLQAALGGRTQDVIVVSKGRAGEAIIVVPASRDRTLRVAERVMRLRADQYAHANLAISTVCHTVADYPSAYREAQQILSVAELQSAKGKTIDVGTIGIHRLVLNASRPEELVRFADDLLKPLEDYDQRRDGTLVPTLRTYLNAGGGVATTARSMTVHKNTIRYRLHKAEELMSVRLSDENQRLAVNLALVIRSLTQLDDADHDN